MTTSFVIPTEGKWFPVSDGDGARTRNRQCLKIGNTVVHMFESSDIKGVWLASCLPFFREAKIGRLSEDQAKLKILAMVEGALMDAAAQVGRAYASMV
jgi:hypothetical protein